MSVVVGYFPGGSLSDGSWVFFCVFVFVFDDDDSGVRAGTFYVVHS